VERRRAKGDKSELAISIDALKLSQIGSAGEEKGGELGKLE